MNNKIIIRVEGKDEIEKFFEEHYRPRINIGEKGGQEVTLFNTVAKEKFYEKFPIFEKLLVEESIIDELNYNYDFFSYIIYKMNIENRFGSKSDIEEMNIADELLKIRTKELLTDEHVNLKEAIKERFLSGKKIFNERGYLYTRCTKVF
jgi:hypothetical protein